MLSFEIPQQIYETKKSSVLTASILFQEHFSIIQHIILMSSPC